MRTPQILVLPAMLVALFGCQREPASALADVRQQPEAAVRPTSAPPALAPGQSAHKEPTPASESRLRVETWDFGVISPGTELRHRYTIRNSSATSWTIKEVTPSCSCTCGEFTSRTIKPAESTSVEVVFRAGNRDAEVYQAIMIEFAQTGAPYFQLAMKGEIRGFLSPSPPNVDFGRAWARMKLSRSIQLRNYSDQDVTITKIEAPDWLHTDARPAKRVEPGSRPRQSWKITIDADVSKFKAAEGATLVIHTNTAKIGPVVIPVHLEMRPPFEVVPQSLDFRTVPAGGAGQQALMLDVARELGDLSEQDLVLTHNLGEELEIQLFKMGSQNRFRLMSIFRPKRSTGAVQGELEIKPRAKNAPSVRVPISAFVR